MVLGWSKGWSKRGETRPGGQKNASSAWQRIVETQQTPQMPCLLVPQPAHAVLAGELAGALLAETFGILPHEIQQAILMHDAGWSMIDSEQIRRLRSASGHDGAIEPTSFVAASPEETVEAWTASIGHVERLSAAGGLVASRHFTYLARRGHAVHRKFVTAEQQRQRRLEAAAKIPANDLTRWTAALGFCDLVSLYLITGLKSDISFPLAHPSSPEAQSAPRVTLRLDEENLHFTPAIWPVGFTAEIEALKHPIGSGGGRTERLSWMIV
jgi:hypothetical protein